MSMMHTHDRLAVQFLLSMQLCLLSTAHLKAFGPAKTCYWLDSSPEQDLLCVQSSLTLTLLSHCCEFGRKRTPRFPFLPFLMLVNNLTEWTGRTRYVIGSQLDKLCFPIQERERWLSMLDYHFSLQFSPIICSSRQKSGW